MAPGRIERGVGGRGPGGQLREPGGQRPVPAGGRQYGGQRGGGADPVAEYVVLQGLGGGPLPGVQPGPPGGGVDQGGGLRRIDPEAGRGGRQVPLRVVLEQVDELVEQDPAQGGRVRPLDPREPLQ
ncbi:hypothetical protein WKI68_10935 [Streptomyces sp. MS1.HAVA.3]|uniref:Uncharacterized protein n=1 Tax=Streptomyces caledonius TaxID=3134107 RepID=A0ABU8U1T5_9ACTN